MKKTILKLVTLTFITTVSLMSCSSDEPTSNLELFGEWKYQQRLVDGVDKLDDCQRKSTTNIKENGTFESTFFLEENGDCKIDDSATGNWERIGGNKFTIVGKGVTIILVNENKYESFTNDKPNYKEVWIK